MALQRFTARLRPLAVGAPFAPVDAFAVRPLLLVVVWILAGSFPQAHTIRVTVVALTAFNMAAGGALLLTSRRLAPLLPIVNTLCWGFLSWSTGGGQSPFVLGFFLEIGLAALRLSTAACRSVSALGVLELAVIAWQDGNPMSRSVALTGMACVLVTGGAFTLMLQRLRNSPDVDRERQRTAYLAHGIKNSLHGVSGFAELLASDLTPEDPRHGLTQHIRTGLDEAHSRLGQLMTSPQTSQETRRPHTLRTSVDKAVETSRGLLARERVRDCIDVPTDLRAHFDPDNLHDVLVNLIHNAVQAMRPRGGELELRSELEPLRLLVRDSGPGIPAELRERIFEPHYTTSPNGHGLGLAEAREKVRGFGGELRALAVPRGGAAFEIRFPTNAETPRRSHRR
ncbi:MAG: ATP-binding protein [Candidatus Krumholzibacteriia bacterium]